ncbi:HlyD family efflux transporter periplasmic adaptor subunit [Rossellomorea marisflavi]|uniref:efflux RND transporter periplasmic adaptor subunit n=1 Tax=Rossellomorea marisflavi TaxID=189381 RepID=UPI0027A4D5B9|nr:HlyD family efflux transporter periplasmic adaptor subunit [Rossellomorea marisflavi]UTE73335.1 HlyD family efflux transporter periplasmic adaptor subunit [Rossellomorea marisflavi]
MMKKLIRYSIVTVSLVFVGVNTYLIEKADSRVNREVRINHWELSRQETLRDMLYKPGVVIPEEDQYLYFNDESATFKKFLVKEGEQVKSGTPLYEYEVSDQLQQRDVLKSEVEKLEEDASNVEDSISELSKLVSSLPSPSSDEKDVPIEAGALQSEYDIKREMVSKQLEADQLESHIKSLEKQIAAIDSYETTLTVESSVSGTVKSLSHEIQNPLVTIASDSTVVTTDLTEQEVDEVDENLNVRVKHDGKKSLDGVITKVDRLPKADPHLKTESLYPAEVQVQEAQWRPGQHVSLSIIMEEAKDAVTVPVSAIEKVDDQAYLWMMTKNGTVKKRKIETGLEVDGRQAITAGVKAGEMYVEEPDEIASLKDQERFITALDWRRLKIRDFKTLDRADVYTNLMLGILERK